MYGLKYDNEDTDVYDAFEKRNDELNDTSEYDDLFGTHDGFGETKEKNDTYKRLKDASEKYIEYKYDGEDPQHETPRVRVTSESKNSKMKRLIFVIALLCFSFRTFSLTQWIITLCIGTIINVMAILHFANHAKGEEVK